MVETNTRARRTRGRADNQASKLAAPSPTVQTKLRVGASDDRYEREADATADEVVARLSVGDATTSAPAASAPSTSAEGVQRRAVGAAGGDLDDAVSARIESARGGGSALAPDARARMEQAFGTDFGGVRVHTGAEAQSLNDHMGAQAFATGSDLFFRNGAPDTSTAAGQHLMAHELAHVVQQRGGDEVQRFWGKKKDKDLAGAAAAGKGGGRTAEVDDTTLDSLESSLGASLGGTNIAKDANDYRGDITKATSGKDAKVTGTSGDDATQARIGAASGATEFVGMFITIAKSVKTFKDPKKDGGDKAGAALEMIQGVSGGASGMTKMVDQGAKAGGATDGVGASDAASKALGGITDMFGVVKETFYTIKGIVDLAEKATEMSDEEKFKASMDIVRHSLEAAKSGVSMVKGFLDLANSGVSAATVNAVPGLGIAIGCAELVVRGYDTVVSTIAWADMRDKKREMKGAANKGKSWKAEALRIKGDASASEEDKEKAEEYLTAKSLQYINAKRIRRALLKIGVAMTKIAGDATTLGGVSAPVGIGLKVGAVVIDAGAGIFRKFKQAMRDKVAADPANNAKLAKIFNADKSTTAKLAEYNRIIDHVFSMIEKAAPAGSSPTPAEQAKIDRVGKYISAMGFSVEAMYRDAGDGTKLRLAMVEALRKRE